MIGWCLTSVFLDPENHVRATPMKRKNFSVEEITLLKRLIQKYRPYQIESKKTDSVNLGEKQRIWENITKEFNTHFPYSDEVSKPHVIADLRSCTKEGIGGVGTCGWGVLYSFIKKFN